jgi:hypothetical protein
MRMVFLLLLAAPAHADEELLVSAPTECRPSNDRKWTLTTESKLADVLKAAAEITCERFLVPRGMAATKVMVDLGPDTLTSFEMRRRLEGALRAKGIVLDSTSVLRARKASDLSSFEVARGSPSQAVPPEKLEEGIRCTGERCTLTKEVRDAILADAAGIATSARIVPYFKEGKVTGLKLFAIRPSSYFARLNLQNGDAILSFDGMDISSPDKALEAYARASKKSSFKVEIERRGQRMTLEYVVK